MKKSYLFDVTKYYNEADAEKLSAIITNYYKYFGSNNIAELKLKDDVRVVVKNGEEYFIHMVIENGDDYAALPKSLKNPKAFINKFIIEMSKKVDEEKKRYDVEASKAALEDEAEANLLKHIGVEPAAKTTSTDRVVVNGKEITDAEGKEAVKEAVNEAIAERANALYDRLRGALGEDFVSKFIKQYIN